MYCFSITQCISQDLVGTIMILFAVAPILCSLIWNRKINKIYLNRNEAEERS